MATNTAPRPQPGKQNDGDKRNQPNQPRNPDERDEDNEHGSDVR
jgi:hypothetical protein